MNIPDSITNISDLAAQPFIQPFPEYIHALKLGIEALKRESNNRINPGAYADLPLPGETED
ncbi:unnamed protein product [marine sediment metagenome]|uniref:Uncharacterized protein n=1 Tax=marine sediment metagenome TaxID=412755 RepID=X1NLR9_9ZZZZ